MPLRFEAWPLPGSGTFEKKFDIPVAMPGSAGVREMSAYSDESIMVPASYSRLPELVSETTGSLIRVYRRDKIIDEFDAARVSLTAGKPNTRTVSGPQRNGLIEGIGVAPRKYPEHKEGAFDHIWGGENLLPDLALADLGSIREVWEVWHDHTSGAWNIDVEGDDVDIDHDASAGDIEGTSETLSPPGSGLQGLTTVDDVTVSGAGTEDDPYVITFYAPPDPSSVTVTENTLSGGTTFSATKTVEGALDPSPITKSKPVDAQAGDESDHGNYGDPEIEVVTDITNTGSDWSLKVNAESGFAGSQIVIDVTPGETYSQIKVPLRPTVSGNYIIVIRDIYENLVAQDRNNALTADTFQDLTIDEATIPASVNQVMLRVACDDDNPDPHYVDWQGAEFREGEPETTFTAIVSRLLSLGQDRGAGTWLELDATDAADTAGTALPDISFTAYAGDNAHLGHVMDEGRKNGYQWRIVPAEDAQVITPASSTTHVLQIYKVDADEIEDLTASPGGPSVTVGAKGVAEAQVVSRRIPYTTLIGLGVGNLSVEDSNATAESALGRIERIVDVEHLGSEASVQDYLDAQFAEQTLNLKAATATVLETARQLPGVDYAEGSKIWWQFPGILDKEARPVKRFSWTHGMTARFRLEGSRILTGEAAVVSAVDMLLRKQGRRRSSRSAPSPSQLVSGGGASQGAYLQLSRSSVQSIAVDGEPITWTSQIVSAANFASPSFPTTDITIQEPGYYNVAIQLGWSVFEAGGSVWVTRTRGGVEATVWPHSSDPGLWTTSDGQFFEGVAPAIPCKSGDIIKVYVDHDSGTARDLASATVAVYLVDRVDTRTRYRDVVLADDPDGYWELADTSGTTAADSSANSHDGTYVGSPSLQQPGVMRDGFGGTSVELDGSSQYVTVPVDAVLGLTDITVEAWINVDSLGRYGIFNVNDSGAGDAALNRWGFWALASGELQYTADDDSNLWSSTGTISAGQDHHVVFTRTAAGDLIFYIDGQAVGSHSGVDVTSAQAGDTVQIGMDIDDVGNTDHLDGHVDEVAVYGRVLTASEIAEHYLVGSSG